MPEFRQQEASLYVSNRRETAFNTPFTAGADFLRATTQNPIVLIPEMEKTDDSNRAGNASEFPTTQCNQYWLPIAASFQDQGNFGLFGRLALRAAGGTVTQTVVVASTAFRYTANMLPKSTGLQYPSSTIISELGGASFLFPGCVVDRFRLSQDGVNPVQCQFDMIGSGKHRSPHAVTSLPALPTFSCLKPKSFLEYTDTGGLKDLTLGCRVRSWSVEIANNHAPQDDRCIGDSSQNAGDFTASGGASDAAYLSKLTRGNRTVTAQIVILLDSTTPEWVQMAQNEVLTNVTFGARGNVLAAGPPQVPESLKVILPNARFSAVQEVDSSGKAALTLTFKAMHDASALGARVEVVNNTASNFD
jgi:hypothetical protein